MNYLLIFFGYLQKYILLNLELQNYLNKTIFKKLKILCNFTSFAFFGKIFCQGDKNTLNMAFGLFNPIEQQLSFLIV